MTEPHFPAPISLSLAVRKKPMPETTATAARRPVD
jgi:hypothetical protein